MPLRSAVVLVLLLAASARAESGDPQVMTDHPWYPGELSFSTFERLFKTQSELYKRETGRDTNTDEDKALASWYWRNLHVSHSTDSPCDYFGKGFEKSDYNREYWAGLFAFGYGLCYTTHAQWCGEMERLLGHTRARAVNVPGHVSFEVFLTGGPYGNGNWVLLDHDISTVIYNEQGTELLSIKEIAADLKKYSNPEFKPERQHWRVAGLHPKDAEIYTKVNSALYQYGYAGAPPMLRLRSGESLRRYIWPGLDNKTYAFWGYNFMKGGIPGPTRARSWVNQPEKMYNAKKSTSYVIGTARFGNAFFTYKPDFASGKYKEGVVDEGADYVTFEHVSPYIIAATPPDLDAKPKPKPFGIYDSGCKNGLVLKGKLDCPVKISLDHGKTWQDAGKASDGMDLTDFVKGSYQYWLRLEAAPQALAGSGLTILTDCQCGQTVTPRLKDGKNTITFLAGGTSTINAGPTMALAKAHIVDGKIGSSTVTMELAAPRGEKAVGVYACGHVASGNPPDPDIAYQIDYSIDGGKTWQPVVKDWKILRRGEEPGDFWSQSMCFGNAKLDDVAGPVRVRFSNSGGKAYLRTEAQLVYKTSNSGPVDVTFAWKEGGGEIKTATHTYAGEYGKEDSTWVLETGQKVETVWVEYAAK